MGLWRTALFISPSVRMLMRLYALLCVCVRVAPRVRTRVFAHVSLCCGRAPACSLCRVCLLPAKPLLSQRRASCTGSVTAPRLPRELLQRFFRFPPSRTAGAQGGSGGSNAGHKKKKKKFLLHLCVSGNPRDTSVASFCYF